MFSDSLEQAIGDIERGRLDEAQKILKRLIAKDHHDLPVWFWFLETCTTNQQRLKVLELCLENNPENKQVIQAIERLRLLPPEPLPDKLPEQLARFEKAHSSKKSYRIYRDLIILSITSALIFVAIDSLGYAFFAVSGDRSLFFFIFGAFELVNLPICAVYLFLSSRNKGLHLVIGIGIPLIFSHVVQYIAFTVFHYLLYK